VPRKSYGSRTWVRRFFLPWGGLALLYLAPAAHAETGSGSILSISSVTLGAGSDEGSEQDLKTVFRNSVSLEAKCRTQSTLFAVCVMDSAKSDANAETYFRKIWWIIDIPGLVLFDSSRNNGSLTYAVATTDNAGDPLECPAEMFEGTFVYTDLAGGNYQSVDQSIMGSFYYNPTGSSTTLDSGRLLPSNAAIVDANFSIFAEEVSRWNKAPIATSCTAGELTLTGATPATSGISNIARASAFAFQDVKGRITYGLKSESLANLADLEGNYASLRYRSSYASGDTGRFETKPYYFTIDDSGEIVGGELIFPDPDDVNRTVAQIASIDSLDDPTDFVAGSLVTITLTTQTDFPFKGGVRGTYTTADGRVVGGSVLCATFTQEMEKKTLFCALEESDGSIVVYVMTNSATQSVGGGGPTCAANDPTCCSGTECFFQKPAASPCQQKIYTVTNTSSVVTASNLKGVKCFPG